MPCSDSNSRDHIGIERDRLFREHHKALEQAIEAMLEAECWENSQPLVIIRFREWYIEENKRYEKEINAL